MEDGSGWFADPEVEGQERYFDGSEWTTETRSADSEVPLHHLPEHTGELQRALAAATDDIDEVEDRLGSLFDRAEQLGERQGRAARKAQPKGDDVEDDHEVGDDGEVENWLDDEHEDDDTGQNVYVGEPGSIERGVALAAGADQENDDDALAELDEALATEEPEKLKERKFFRRRS